MKSLNKSALAITSLTFIALIFASINVLRELYLASILVRVDSLSLLVQIVNQFESLGNTFLVRLVMSFSDMNFQFINVLSALRLDNVIAPVFLMFAYDLNKNYVHSLILKIGITTFFSAIVAKYVLLVLSLFIFTSSVSYAIVLLLIIAIILVISNVILILSLITIFISLIKIVRRVNNVRII